MNGAGARAVNLGRCTRSQASYPTFIVPPPNLILCVLIATTLSHSDTSPISHVKLP